MGALRAGAARRWAVPGVRACLLLGVGLCGTWVAVAGAVERGGWGLIWQDEFDGATLDASRWRVEDRHLIKNNELQYYAPDEVYLEDGCLVLRSRARHYCGYDNHGQWGCYDYTSGLVDTKARFALMYGRVEVRAQLPSTQGLWPAHWMLPSPSGWPPEIDIMELLGHEPTRVYMTHHWGTWPDVFEDGGDYVGPDFSQGFHTFAIEWFADRIYWYVDDVVRFTSTIEVPQQAFYITLNTAVGGRWPGNPDASTVFPQYHRIEYVRVYGPVSEAPPAIELVDVTGGTAQADGVIAPGEYVASASGTNSALGDRIGRNSVFCIDSAGDGRLNIAFDSAAALPAAGTYGIVVYVDAVDGGFASTVDLGDAASRACRLASGVGTSGQAADLYFAPGFAADYAICLEPNYVTILQLGTSSHSVINGAALGAATDIFGGNAVRYRLDDGSAGGRVREVELRLEHVGVTSGDALDLVATLLNGDTAFRANEFVGITPGNAWDAVNPGTQTVVLKLGDALRFHTIPPRGDVDGDGVIGAADFAVFGACMTGPDVTPAPAAPLEAGACLRVFDFDDDHDSDLPDFAALQAAAGGMLGR